MGSVHWLSLHSFPSLKSLKYILHSCTFLGMPSCSHKKCIVLMENAFEVDTTGFCTVGHLGIKDWIPPRQAYKLAIMAAFWESASRLRKQLIWGQNLWWLEWPLCEDKQSAAVVFLWGTRSWVCVVRHAQRIPTGAGGTEEWHREQSSVGLQTVQTVVHFWWWLFGLYKDWPWPVNYTHTTWRALLTTCHCHLH